MVNFRKTGSVNKKYINYINKENKMKTHITKLFYLLMVSVVVFFYGCSKDSPTDPDPVQINESEVLLKYIEANGDFMNTACPAMVSASDVYNNVFLQSKDWALIDIRSASDFTAQGHIAGAINVQPGDLLTYYRNNNLQDKERVILVCYTGQTAGWGSALLRILGYNNTYDLKWGMSSWNNHFATQWKNAVGNSRAMHFNQVNYPKPAAGQLPVLNTGKTTGAEILEARVQAIFSEGFTATRLSHADLFSNLGNYFIANYWPLNHYNLGHIEGAIQYTPKEDFKFDTYIKTLPTNKTILVYCYTGQTSAHVVPILRALGYDAKSLLYGVNALNFDILPANKFVETEISDYPFVQ
jgi:rhodanese-related sulfurtransferase